LTQIPLINGIPALGLGTYPLQADECSHTVRMAIGLGYRHIDTAQMYGNEAAVGAAIKSCGVARSDLFVTTKVDPGNVGADIFSDSVKKSIEDLGGPVDLLLIHWPPALADVEAVLDRLATANSEGFTKRIGVSNFPSQLMHRAKLQLANVSCNQVEFQPLLDQAILLKAAEELDMPLVAYSPLARGAALKPQTIVDIAAHHGRPPSEIVLRWIYQMGVIAIPMTTKPANAASNLRMFDFALSAEDMAAITAIGSKAGRTIAPEFMEGRWD
jgi:2,5-diketo-D-gluconate reductase B